MVQPPWYASKLHPRNMIFDVWRYLKILVVSGCPTIASWRCSAWICLFSFVTSLCISMLPHPKKVGDFYWFSWFLHPCCLYHAVSSSLLWHPKWLVGRNSRPQSNWWVKFGTDHQSPSNGALNDFRWSFTWVARATRATCAGTTWKATNVLSSLAGWDGWTAESSPVYKLEPKESWDEPWRLISLASFLIWVNSWSNTYDS